MELNTLYLLMRFHSLCEAIKDRDDCDFKSVYEKIRDAAGCDIVSKIPQDILSAADELCTDFSKEGLCELLALLLPYKEQCESFLPDLSAQNEQFTALAAEKLSENGYFLKDGIFRKVRKNHLYIIECELASRFVADKNGHVIKIAVFPYIRVADAHVKFDKSSGYSIAGSISDDEATVTDAKLYDNHAFYKTLRHLDSFEFEIGEEAALISEQIELLADNVILAAAVCENRAIPHYYKKLLRSDIPFSKAFILSLFSGSALFVLLTISLALLCGLMIFIIFGYKRIWGLFEVPYYYMFTAIVSLIYSIVVFNRVRSGR